MPRFIEQELQQFYNHFNKLKNKYTILEFGEDMYIISPLENPCILPTQADPSDKKIAMTIGALTHGNEWAGLGVVNDILSLLATDIFSLKVSLGIVLGNVAAARVNKRFLEHDLNRCFVRKQAAQQTWSLEEKRAKSMEPFLAQTQYFIDLHQTILRSDEAFFIFPYDRSSFEFARAISPLHAVVTHWGKGFSTEGMCTDEFVIHSGAKGISFETGQNGFDPYQISTGVQLVLSAIAFVQAQYLGEDFPSSKSQKEKGKIYTFKHSVPYPQNGLVQLKEGFYNFKNIEKGDFLAQIAENPLLSPISGKLLFPKYVDAKSSRPSELLRILGEIAESDLPESTSF